MNSFFTKKRMAAGIILLIVLLALPLTDLRYIFLPRTELMQNILHEEPVTAIKLDKNEAEFPLYTGFSEVLTNTPLFEHNGVSLLFENLSISFPGDVETGKQLFSEATLSMYAPFFLKDGKLCFIAPIKPEALTSSLEFYANKENDLSAEKPTALSQPVLIYGDKSTSQDWSEIYLTLGGNSSVALYMIVPLCSTFEEADDLFMDDGIYSTTLHLDDLYYYEFSLNPLQQVILGGVLQ